MSKHLVPKSAYKEIMLSEHPIMDVRAPIEFNKGAFPSSTNLPLMQDGERQKVGTCYKDRGQAAAIELGHSLVRGKIKQRRVDAWLEYLEQNPDAYLCCFRGGLRSQLSQQWLKDAGLSVPYIEGGYKAMRQYLIDVIDDAPNQKPTFILSGITGSGKTDFLVKRTEAVDLEGIAHHRGSSFGRYHEPQPSQINFENRLAVELLKHQDRHQSCLVLEDESFLIGRSAIPKTFYTAMQSAQVLVLDESDENRHNRLLEEYVHKMHSGYVERLGEEAGFIAFSEYLSQSITGIKKRLGGQLHDEFQSIITHALNVQQQRNSTEAHLEWITLLLSKYYDPMYQFQLDKKQSRVVFKGNHQAMHEWLDDYATK
ncbi:tRNA 2-selenouridine(34) synthase MnmH [Shewanella eurypsychrophilus]|uniref:tRNA 2-selenouridine synthase n=1 Tax=Shewanella eurypsychrophilus TaxID=2593656 RepID=A0ABX6VBU4_9GAMM|nr:MULTISPECIES: tRNA 2-selenouridine(34) synthase MnmH [Shewanella]QFU24920.1 tRNA 2-selenouridine(34) synthase MnmH [Shewanella sp. YLB-09]QPG60104.1 tRNA 2-selenouridine(34) synthase MnmH [Shewanella eurypsychrophilus]